MALKTSWKSDLQDANLLNQIHPGRLTWNLQITHSERKMIFQTSMIMFHVNLQGCNCDCYLLEPHFWCPRLTPGEKVRPQGYSSLESSASHPYRCDLGDPLMACETGAFVGRMTVWKFKMEGPDNPTSEVMSSKMQWHIVKEIRTT